MPHTSLRVSLPDEAATERLGQDIALILRPGDTILLSGDLGAGKTALARAVIRALSDDPALEVPSPTYTLVQSYDASVPVRHFDLYRLTSPDELTELGLDEALGEGAALVEWPERAADSFADDAVTVGLTHEGVGRAASISGTGAAFERIARSLEARRFLADAGWTDARRAPLSGDASARSYETVSLPGEADRLLMNSPPLVLGPPVRDGKPYALIAHTAQNVTAFAAIDQALREAGFAAPLVHARDLDRGFLLVEKLGEETLVDGSGEPVEERYVAVARLLAAMHARDWPAEIAIDAGPTYAIPPFDRDAMLIEAELAMEWYVPEVNGAPPSSEQRAAFRAAWSRTLDRIGDAELTLMLRDVQSPNFLWRPWLEGHDRLGIIDFQDALIGPAAYDVASLALDPRVTIPQALQASIVRTYVAERQHQGKPFDETAFSEAFAVMGAQRHTKILGIFVRLFRRDGKAQYLKQLPRIRDYLRGLLRHPSLVDVRQFYDEIGLLEPLPK